MILLYIALLFLQLHWLLPAGKYQLYWPRVSADTERNWILQKLQ